MRIDDNIINKARRLFATLANALIAYQSLLNTENLNKRMNAQIKKNDPKTRKYKIVSEGHSLIFLKGIAIKPQSAFAKSALPKYLCLEGIFDS
jgi:hypothetical protein